MTGLRQTRLADLPNLVDTPGCSLRRLGGENVMLQEAKTPKGNRFPTHAHHNEQLVLVLEGRIRLTVGEKGAQQAHELGAGDMLIIPPNVPHSGETLEDCRLLDAFSPPRTTVLGEEEPE
ncbi:MAG: cupin domain-containing protein [Pseudomonadota bacterium]